jgi:hypothetical protein
LRHAKQDTHDCCIPLACVEKNERRNDNVPHSWKAIEPDILSLLICAGKPQSTGNQDESRNNHCQAWFYNVHSNQEDSRHYNAGDIVNNKVKHVSVDMGSVDAHIEPTSDRPIDSIENLADNEPYKCRSNVAIDDGLQRNQPR